MNNRQTGMGGVCDLAGAKAVARSIIEQYDRNGKGWIYINEVPSMMVDAYRSINKGFNPSQADSETYHKVLDKDSDGKVTLQDLEELSVKYLVADPY